MARYIDASPKQRYFQYLRPAARAALKRGDHQLGLKAILANVERLGARPSEEGLAQRQWDRRIDRLRADYRAIARQERRDRWLAGETPPPAEVLAEYAAAGQAVPSWLRS